MTEMWRLMTQLKLTVNEAKTHILRRLPQERFEFLGYDFGRLFLAKDGACLSMPATVEGERQMRVPLCHAGALPCC